ncbi:MAG: hypothetical protein DDT23_00849 [candidate division WS2 bacterium]|nr:hypothetical protein [Candidatus Lithacetigena glycinireducens]
MEGFRTGIRETFQVKTLVMLLAAVIGYMAARLLQQHVLRRIDFLARTPEVSDLLVMVLGAGFIRGDNGTAVVIGAGISLVNNLGTRFRIDWLRVG